MADIKIENLNISGFELFADPEGFLTELDDNDLGNINGGLMNADVTTANSCCCGGSCTCPAKDLEME